MKRTFFIDADGTLVNTMPAIYDSLCNVFLHFGINPPLFSEYVLGIRESYYDFYKERISELESEEHLMSLWKKYLADHDSEMPETFEGADEFLDFAISQDVEIVLLSANGGSTIDRWLSQKNRRNKFAEIYLGETRKADVIDRHLSKTGKEKVWSYMIGDSLLDCHAAKTSGIEFSGVLHDLSLCTAEHRVPPDCLIKIRHHFEGQGYFVAESFQELSLVLLSA